MTRGLVVVLVLAMVAAACGGDDDPPRSDARVDSALPADADVDAEVPDAAQPDANEIDAAPAVAGTYVASRIQVPASTTEVQSFGLDLDSDQPEGDAGIDNQLGAVLSALNTMALDTQASLDVAVQTGAAILLLAVDATDVHTAVGLDPDPPACAGPGDCGHHLEGGASFGVAPGVEAMPLGAGGAAGPGTAVLPITVIGSDVVELRMFGARFEGTFTTTGFSGKLGGVISTAQIQAAVIPAIAQQLQAQVAIDCPGATGPLCDCTPDSPGETYLATFDDDDNCVITTPELAANPLIQGFLAPDVTYEGVDGLSFGVRLTGVTGTYTLP